MWITNNNNQGKDQAQVLYRSLLKKKSLIIPKVQPWSCLSLSTLKKITALIRICIVEKAVKWSVLRFKISGRDTQIDMLSIV